MTQPQRRKEALTVNDRSLSYLYTYILEAGHLILLKDEPGEKKKMNYWSQNHCSLI